MALLSAQTATADFSMSFKWGSIPVCTTGKPNKVANPKFVLKGVPAGTISIDFRLKDLNVPGYNNGGGKLKITASGTVPSGAFNYKSPCPPNGSNTYEWTATACKGSKALATAKARRKYP
ncbi:MAG: hypothetical protein ACI8R4_000221 [Paracoccaceae bacterium]